MNKTEQRNPNTTHIDKMSTEEMLTAIQRENENAVKAVGDVVPSITEAVDRAFPRMQKGGRLIYIGCGTSGRLGVIDASECPPTYGVPHDLVVGIIAGGDGALRKAGEGAEDSAADGIRDISALNINENDTVVGISAAGGAAYVLGALEYAKNIGALTIGISSNPGSPISQLADVEITPDTGAEPITGSTRMKAGTAQKLILNMLSTSLMVKLGHVYENLMINLRPTNIKLRGRMIRITADILGCDETEAEQRLETAEWNIRRAVESK